MSKTPINLNDKPDKEAELGTLIVVLLKARNLNDKHSFRKQDVFAQASLNGAQKRTHVDIKGGQHPEWDGEVRFHIMKNQAAKYRKLEVACYAQEPRSEDLLGKGVVDITETLRTGEFDDWVSLEIDGVQRGELYLEMTYYANAPAPVVAAAPNKFLSAVQTQNSNLNRRPSKLSPADRLTRPQTGRPQVQSSAQAYDQPPSSKYSSPHSHSRLNEHFTPQSPGPGLGASPNALPASLKPNYPSGSSPKGRQDALPANEPYHSHPDSRQGSLGLQQPQATLPTTLRPGPASASPPTSLGPSPIPIQRQNEFGHVRHPSSSPPSNGSYFSNANRYEASPQGSSPNPYIGGGVSSPNPYVGGNNTLAAGIGLGPGRAYSPAPPSVSSPAGPGPVQGPYTGYGTPPNGPPIIWRQDSAGAPPPSNGSFSFPIPAVSPTNQRQSSYPYNDLGAVYNSRPGPSPVPTPSMSYLQNRPPMAMAASSDDPYLQARYQTPLPLPPGASSHSPKAPVSASVPTTPPRHMGTPGPDLARLEALKRAEDEARRRREQELKDLELAMALDRELNVAEERASSGGRPAATAMPGSW